MDHNGGERLCSTAANVDHAVGFVSDRRGIYQDERKAKNQKISFTVLATLLGTTAIAALIGIVMVMLFGLDGASFTEGAAETARIAELAERSTQVQDFVILSTDRILYSE